MRSLVTGVSGFVGGYLAKELLKGNQRVFGMKRWRSDTSHIEEIKNHIGLVECDLTDTWAVQKAIKDVQPDEVYHLAAQSYVDASYRNPTQTLQDNIIGTANLFEAIRQEVPDTKIHFASSSEVYGQVAPNETPITDKNSLRPASPYAISKAACDLLAQHYNRAYGMRIVITRSFSHTGPGRGDVFVESSFAKQIAEIESGKRDVLKHGNLDSVRTWLDVRDIVRLFVLANRMCAPGVYVVGGDETRTVHQVLDYLMSLSTKPVKTREDLSRMRPSDVTMQIPDSNPIREITGWEPTIKFEKTMLDLLTYWREHDKRRN